MTESVESVEIGGRTRTPIKLANLFFAVAFATLTVRIGTEISAFRAYEAHAASDVAEYVLGMQAVHVGGSDLFYFSYHGTWRALRVTDECSAGILVAIVCALTAFFALVGRVPVGRVLLAAASASGLLIVANQLRFAVLVVAYSHWGNAGFRWSHVLVGSLITMIAGLVAYLLYFYICFHRKEPAE